MNVVLIGMKHCGKSTIGRALADRWRCPFYDVDDMIAARHACSTGNYATVRDIFALGAGYFERLESDVVCELFLKLDRPDSSAVVALGGRTALNPRVRELLGSIGKAVFLEVAPEECLARVKRSGLPPFLDDADPAGDFLKLCREREPHYRAMADVTVNLSGLTIDAAVDRVIAALPAVPRST